MSLLTASSPACAVSFSSLAMHLSSIPCVSMFFLCLCLSVCLSLSFLLMLTCVYVHVRAHACVHMYVCVVEFDEQGMEHSTLLDRCFSIELCPQHLDFEAGSCR